MKKKWFAIVLITGCIALFAGCLGGTQTPEEAPVRTVVPAWTDYLSEEDMQVASPWQVCDNSALAAVMKKAEAGEPVTIATIGGSITQGSISNGPLDSEIETRACYADIFFAWWKETFPNTEVNVVNAGIGGTNSYLGVHRVQEDVLDYHPDVVLIEYSVNDGGDNKHKNSYDNLVRKVLKSEDAPAVMLLFMAQTSLVSAQNVHQLIGFNYELPMVSHLNLISEFFETGRYTEEEMSGDVSHPSAFGHALVGEMLWKYLNNVYAELDTYVEPTPFDKKALTKERYQNAELVGVGDITPETLGTFSENGKDFNGWGDVWKTTDGDGNIEFKVTCRNLGILFWRSTGFNYGMYEVWVDGEHKANLQAEFQDGWGSYAYSQEIFVSEEEAEHTIMIKKAEDSEGDDFVLLRLMLSHGEGGKNNQGNLEKQSDIPDTWNENAYILSANSDFYEKVAYNPIDQKYVINTEAAPLEIWQSALEKCEAWNQQIDFTGSELEKSLSKADYEQLQNAISLWHEYYQEEVLQNRQLYGNNGIILGSLYTVISADVLMEKCKLVSVALLSQEYELTGNVSFAENTTLTDKDSEYAVSPQSFCIEYSSDFEDILRSYSINEKNSDELEELIHETANRIEEKFGHEFTEHSGRYVSFIDALYTIENAISEDSNRCLTLKENRLELYAIELLNIEYMMDSQ